MALLETLTVTVGPSIAQAILKSWLKDSPIKAGVATSCIDIIKTKTKDILAQQRGKRQFEDIGERVAVSLLPILEKEGDALGEEGCNAVALAIAETLDSSEIDAKLLVEQGIDSIKLRNYLVESHSRLTRDFSEAETTLYFRVLSESCQYIVDIASQLPTFTERTFAEILKQENHLLNMTRDILSEVQRIRENSEKANPEVEAALFETEYRRAVIRNLDELELFGIDVSLASKRHRLSVAYVMLSVEPKESDFFEENDWEYLRDGDDDSRIVLPVDKALAEARCIVIRGLAGSGKTTLLKWVAVLSAYRSFEGLLSKWDVIPFFIQLRSFVDSELPRPEHFPSLVAPALAGNMPLGWAHKQLHSGRAVVLVDGIDETPELRRSDVRRWLKDLVECYKQAHFIVTSRPHAIREGWMRQEGFVDAELLPMELSDIEVFIDHWHDAVSEELRDYEEKTRLVSLQENLKKVVRRTHSIRELATNPLLCSMLCALHRDRHQQLPEDRFELYEACCYALIERRDLERGLRLQEYLPLNYRQKRALLQDFGYWLLSNGWSEVSSERADKRFELKLASMRDLSQSATGFDARKLFVDRSGIIREIVPGRIDFVHRTFQEFLAAAAAVDEGNVGVLAKNAHDDQWRETITLAAGLATKSIREELINNLIQRGDKEKKYRHQLYLLAVACLEASIEISSNLAEEVQKRLATLVPPKNMNEVKPLASTGELAIPYLYAKPNYKAHIAAACIRTLALIGGEKAQEVLAGYSHDSRRIVTNALLRAWDYFEAEPFARQVFSSRTSLRIGPDSPNFFSVFDKLYYLPNLLTLDLSHSLIEHLEPLSSLRKLTVLDLSGCLQLEDVETLSHLTDLTTLNLAGCLKVDSLWSLCNLRSLHTLLLNGCSRIEHLEPLLDLKNLTILDLSNCRGIDDLESLTNLSQLISLNLQSCISISDLGPLARLANLTSLNLAECAWVNDLWALCTLKNLAELNVSGCPIDDLESLAGLTNLTTLNLADCSIVDLEPLAGLTNLTTLNLAHCPVRDLAPLAGLTNLTTLNLAHCPVRDLAPLAGLTNLTTLNLAHCPVRDLALLIKLYRLTTLNLSGYRGERNLEPLASLSNLTTLDLSDCQQTSGWILVAKVSNLIR